MAACFYVPALERLQWRHLPSLAVDLAIAWLLLANSLYSTSAWYAGIVLVVSATLLMALALPGCLCCRQPPLAPLPLQ